MLTKLAENLYRQAVPLPNNPLREINAYLITGERNLLIDTGFNRPECEEALRSAFDQLGITETDLFITHLHSDHCGLIGKFAREGSVIYAGETDGELINFETGNLYWRMLDALFVKYGFPKADFGYNTDIHPGRKYCQDKRVDFTYVQFPLLGSLIICLRLGQFFFLCLKIRLQHLYIEHQIHQIGI